MSFSYEELISRVMTSLRLREKNAAQDSTDPQFTDQRFFHPFITIARDPGSGGKPIGQEVAKRLGFAFYDHELIEEISRSTKLRNTVLDQIDEKSRTGLQDLIQGLINPNYVSDITYVTQLCKVILSLAYKGNVVILGRGANFMTPSAQGLHVRITAPYAVRVQRTVDFEGLSLIKAREIVQKIEADRRDFVKQYFGKDIRKSEYYDLILNTTFYMPKEAADIVVRAFEKKFGKR